MPPLFLASKTMKWLVSGGNRGVRLLMRCSSKSSAEVGRDFQVRWLNTVAGVVQPRCVNDLVDGAKDLRFGSIAFHCIVQQRNFLGFANGVTDGVLRKNFEERRVIGYSPEQLFAVVAAVDSYQDFLPWCQRSKIIRHNTNGSFDAEMEVGFKVFVERYVSHVQVNKPKSIKTTVSDSSLFDHLINTWEFSPGSLAGTCELYFMVDFKFRSPLYAQMASMVFKEVVSCLVASFSDRCRLIYGPAVQVIENSYGEQRM